MSLFSHEPTGQSSSAIQGVVLDRQQELLIELLRRAGGEVVSYDELRDAGIELPASVVSELELAGVPVDRRWQERGGHRRLGVRLDPSFEPGGLPGGEPPAARAREPDRRPRVRSLIPIALVVGTIVVALLVLAGLTGGGARRAAHRAPPARPRAVAAVARPPRLKAAPRGSEGPTAPQTPPTPVSFALATQFEAEGHDLLQAGQYAQAVPILRRAIEATGEQLGNCIEPVTDTCLTYAYALYDLGRALRLGGDPSAAVPVLEQRLRIDNQRAVVRSELALARAGAPQPQGTWQPQGTPQPRYTPQPQSR